MTIAQLINHSIAAKSEKRRHHRLSVRLPIEYFLIESSCPRLGYTVDVSEGGLLMHVPEKLRVGQNLKIKFYYASASRIDCIQALGEVIRVDSLGKSGKEYKCAVKFVDLPCGILKQLQNFLKSLS